MTMTVHLQFCARRLLLACASGAVLIGGAWAQPPLPLYARLGGQAGIEGVVDAFATKLFIDPRTKAFFTESDPAETRRRLAAQFCDVSGGPCKTVNPDMKKTHSGFDVRPRDFDAVIDLLSQSLSEQQIAPDVQVEFLSKLSGMRSDIVNAPQEAAGNAAVPASERLPYDRAGSH